MLNTIGKCKIQLPQEALKDPAEQQPTEESQPGLIIHSYYSSYNENTL